MSIISFVKSILSKPDPPDFVLGDNFIPHAIGLAPVQYLKITPLALTEQAAQINASSEAILKETPTMNFILYMNTVSSLIQAVEAAAGAYTASSGQPVPGADKMKSVVALVGSAGSAFAAFLPGLESLVGTLVQSYNDSGLFRKAVKPA